MDGADDPERVKFQMVEFLATGSGEAQPLIDQVERLARQAKDSEYSEDKAQYQAWLEEAQSGSLRPLFRTVKSHELTTVRPFGHVEPGLRPYLRFLQWQEIWGATDCAIERVMQVSQQRAKEEAKKLMALSGQDYFQRFRKLPNKAPGPDGWTVQVLRARSMPPCRGDGRGPCPVDCVPGGSDGQEAANRASHRFASCGLQGLDQISVLFGGAMVREFCCQGTLGRRP